MKPPKLKTSPEETMVADLCWNHNTWWAVVWRLWEYLFLHERDQDEESHAQPWTRSWERQIEYNVQVQLLEPRILVHTRISIQTYQVPFVHVGIWELARYKFIDHNTKRVDITVRGVADLNLAIGKVNFPGMWYIRVCRLLLIQSIVTRHQTNHAELTIK